MIPPGIEDASEAVWREYDACWEALDRQVANLRANAAVAARDAISKAARNRAAEASFHRELEQQVRAPARCAPSAISDEPGRVLTTDQLLKLARANGRICPQPGVWRRLHLLLVVRNQRGRSVRAPEPIDEESWSRTPDLDKQLRLREQIEWADRHGLLERLCEGLAAMREHHWHHLRALTWPALDPALPS